MTADTDTMVFVKADDTPEEEMVVVYSTDDTFYEVFRYEDGCCGRARLNAKEAAKGFAASLGCDWGCNW